MRIDLKPYRSWSDLSAEQTLKIVKLLSKGYDRATFLSECFLYLSGWKIVKNKDNESFVFKSKFTFSISAEIYRELCEGLSWIINEVDSIVNPTKIGRAKGCDQDLYDVTLKQYLLAEAYFVHYGQTEEVKDLAIFTAIFYRKWWQKFNDDKIVKRRYKYYLRYPHHLQMMLLWYSGVRLMLKDKFKDLFNSLEGGDTSGYNPEAIYLSTLRALNNGDITVNEQLLNCPCIEALDRLNEMNKQAKKHKK